MEIIDNSINNIPYVSGQKIIYEADYYFKEIIISKTSKKEKKHIINSELYCDSGEEMMQYRMNRFTKELNVKGKLTIEKVILTKKIGYTNNLTT